MLGFRPLHDEIRYRLLDKHFGSGSSIHMKKLMGAPDGYDDSPVFCEMKATGVALGKAEGKARALLAVLAARGLGLSDAQRTQVQDCQGHESLDA